MKAQGASGRIDGRRKAEGPDRPGAPSGPGHDARRGATDRPGAPKTAGASGPTFDIDAVKRGVLSVYPFFGTLAAGVSYEETDRIRTVASDGKTIYYNPAYLGGLTPGGRIFALAHELCHIAFGHIRRGRGKDREVWKAATDAVVNQLLLRDGLEPVPGIIDYPEAIHYDADSYYEILLEQKLAIDLVGGAEQAGAGGSGGQGGSSGRPEEGSRGREDDPPGQTGGETDPDGMRRPGEDGTWEDDHDLWEEAGEEDPGEKDDEEKRRQEEEIFRRLAEMLERDELRRAEDMSSPEPSEEGPGEEPGQDRDLTEEDLLEGDLVLMGQTVSRAGNSILPDTRQVADIGTGPPLIDWRLLLRDSINYGVDWSFTNATLEDGIVRPALEERPMPETEIVLDTSWSVEEDLLRNFLRECKNILQLSKVRAGCFDTVFYGFRDIRTEKDIEDMTFEGGGGTDFDTAVEAFSLRVDNRIIFTDGEADMPKTPLNAIWMVYGEEAIDPPGGTVIHIGPDQLARLRGAQST